jgi:hypothetical protein
VCVLTIVVTGFGVSSLIFASSGCPHPGIFVSTTTTPAVVTNTAVLPPPPFNTNRLSRSFSTSMDGGAGCWDATTAIDKPPPTSRRPRTTSLFIRAMLLHPPRV